MYDCAKETDVAVLKAFEIFYIINVHLATNHNEKLCIYLFIILLTTGISVIIVIVTTYTAFWLEIHFEKYFKLKQN